MVATNGGHDGRGTNGSTSQPHYARASKSQRRVASASAEVRARYLSLVREKYRARGYSNVAIDLLVKSWRKSTFDQYVVYAKLWFRFSMQGLRPTVRNIIEFLTHLHTKGYTHDQICAARSAVGVLSSEENLGKHPDVKRLMKGIFEKTPVFPRFACVWDVRILFNFFRSIPHQKDLSLEMLSKKLAAMLGILAGGQRAQTIHSIDVLDIVATEEKCIIPVYSVIKQTRRGKHMRPMEFKAFHEEKLCLISNLKAYLVQTRKLRKSSKLFISYQKPRHPVTRDTITRWVNNVMGKAGVDTTKYVTHSCRSAASSYAREKKVPLRKIVESCGWTSERTFANHYSKHIDTLEEATVGEQLLSGLG